MSLGAGAAAAGLVSMDEASRRAATARHVAAAAARAACCATQHTCRSLIDTLTSINTEYNKPSSRLLLPRASHTYTYIIILCLYCPLVVGDLL